MSMNVGGLRGTSAEINMTPMIDVLLTLLIIFMVLLPNSHGEAVDIPQPAPPNTPQPLDIIDKTIVLELNFVPNARPELKINHERVSWQDLRTRLVAIFDLRQDPDKVMFLKADPTLEWDDVAQAIDTAHVAGVKNVGLLTKDLQP